MNEPPPAELPLFDDSDEPSKSAGKASTGAQLAERESRDEPSGDRTPRQDDSAESRDQAKPKSQKPEGERAEPGEGEAKTGEGRSRASGTNTDDPQPGRSETGNVESEANKQGDQSRSKKGNGKRNDERSGNKKRNRKRDDRKRDDKKREVPTGPAYEGEGLLEVSSKGFGFLRHPESDFKQAPNDIFVTPELVRNYGLRDGMWIKCMVRDGKRGPQLCELLTVCGKNPEESKDFPYFEELTAVNPRKRIQLETRPDLYTTRVVDLITPVGRGQRGLIVAPPRTGKTTLLQQMAEAVHANHEGMKIFVLLVDERPEEVTELKRALPFAEVMASSNDQDVKSHTRIAQLAIERSKRLVEAGEHVFLLLDSITRLARAFNNAMKGNKRGISKGGLAVGALETPRRLFAAARNTREAGSLTIIGTALVQTNSKMDESIFQEFKGTGNMELVLDRKIAEQYIWPAVNIHASGTRREELLLAKHQLEKIYVIRRGLAGHKPIEAMERLLSLMERFPNNAQMLMELKSAAT